MIPAQTAARRAGVRYEHKVIHILRTLYGDRVHVQVPLAGGFADAVILGVPTVVVECKTTLCAEGFRQLERYRSGIRSPSCGVLVCRAFDLRYRSTASVLGGFEALDSTQEDRLYILPWSGRFRT